MEGIRQQYIDMVTRFEEARWISVQYWMLQDFKEWYDNHQDKLTEEEKMFLNENIRLKPRKKDNHTNTLNHVAQTHCAASTLHKSFVQR